jgi:hypothetical protein
MSGFGSASNNYRSLHRCVTADVSPVGGAALQTDAGQRWGQRWANSWQGGNLWKGWDGAKEQRQGSKRAPGREWGRHILLPHGRLRLYSACIHCTCKTLYGVCEKHYTVYAYTVCAKTYTVYAYAVCAKTYTVYEPKTVQCINRELYSV